LIYASTVITFVSAADYAVRVIRMPHQTGGGPSSTSAP